MRTRGRDRRNYPELEEGQRAFLRGKLERAMDEDPRVRELRTRLLEIGGRELVWPRVEEDLGAILERGRPLNGTGAESIAGQPSRCHANVIAQWRDREGVTVMTGYALSDDGLWRPHSWCVREGQVLETTDPRDWYYGFELTDEEILEMAFWVE